MVWSKDLSLGNEAAKIAHLVVPYVQGRGLDIGCGPYKVWPTCIGVDNLKDYGGQRPQGVDIISEADKLDIFTDESLDYVFSSHFLEHVKDHVEMLKEWWRVIKPGGNLVLYLPHKKFYPNLGNPNGNPDHKHDFMPEDIIEAMKQIGSWTMLENESRDRDDEYSFFQVYKKKSGKNIHKFKLWERNPEGKKRCLIIRYGAIGDQIMASSILPLLKEQGYHITYNVSPAGHEVLKHDSNIDEWILQEKDFVPNIQLGPYWQGLRFEKRWDKIINLCESIEGGLLTLPGRLQHEYPDDSRHRLFDVNYMERTHDIADVPHIFAPKFHMSKEEATWAERTVKAVDAPIIAWAIHGSASHKVYPWVHIVIAWLLERTPCHVFLMADKGMGEELQKGIADKLVSEKYDISRLHQMAGKWKLRESLSFVQYADCVAGPETGLLNAVCAEEDVAKVALLSHSSAENLTKHWKNTIALEPEKSKCACFPCHRLHYNWDYCNKDESTAAALCASSISPQRVFDAVIDAMKLTPIAKPKNLIGKPEEPWKPDGTSGGQMRKAA